MKQVKDIIHDRPLILIEANDDAYKTCKYCHERIVGESCVYGCSGADSSVFVHKSCGELPEKLPETIPKHIAHPDHPLILILNDPSFTHNYCGVCVNFIRTGALTYTCNDGCYYFLCITCALQEKIIKHMCHDHILAITETCILTDYDVCYACCKPVINHPRDSLYSCITKRTACSSILLHKACTELPKEIMYPMHPNHALTLYPEPQGVSGGCICNACRVEWYRFTYQCLDCKFNICLPCYFQQLQHSSIINHPSHKQHSLRSVNRPACFDCDACSSKAEDSSYICDTCPFWIHKGCANSPTTLVSSFDEHPLILDYSLPERYHKYVPFCTICNQTMNPMHWLYHCLDCRFFAHIRCATNTDPRFVTFPTNSIFIYADYIWCCN